VKPKGERIEVRLAGPMPRKEFIRWRMEEDGVRRSTVDMRVRRGIYTGLHVEMTPTGAVYAPGPGPLVLASRARPRENEEASPAEASLAEDRRRRREFRGGRCACGSAAVRLKAAEPVCQRCDEWEEAARRRGDARERARKWAQGNVYRVALRGW